MKDIDYKRCAEKFITYFQKTGCALDDRVKLKIAEVNPTEKSVTMEFTVSKECRNTGGTTHGGVISWLVDVAMGTTIDVFDREAFGTTIDMNINFLRPILIGQKCTVKAYAVNLGGFLRRARADVYVEGAIVAQATANFTGKKMQGDFRLGYIDEATSKIEDDFVRIFMLEGTEKALVIDTGVSGYADIKEIAETYTGLPAMLINTHADPDHIASNGSFDSCLMHKDDYSLYQQNTKHAVPVSFVRDGDIIDLGNRPIEIIHVPGHTKGSIALLDVNNRVLYAGDTVENGESYLFGDFRNMDDYVKSLEKLDSTKSRFDIIRSSHGDMELPPSIIREITDAAKAVRSGNAHGEARTMYGTPIVAYSMGCTTFLCDAKNQVIH